EVAPAPRGASRRAADARSEPSPVEPEEDHRSVPPREEMVPVLRPGLVEGVVVEDVARLREEAPGGLPAEGPDQIQEVARREDRPPLVRRMAHVVDMGPVDPRVEGERRTEVDEVAQAEDRERERLLVEVLGGLLPHASRSDRRGELPADVVVVDPGEEPE